MILTLPWALAAAWALAALTLAALSVGEVPLCAERLIWVLITKMNPMEATAVRATNDLFMSFSLSARGVVGSSVATA